MRRDEFADRIKQLVRDDPRYHPQAYHFVADAVSYTAKKMRENEPTASRHIRGQELLDGIREYALDRFGPLTLDVLDDWGVRRTEDFGHIVFRMVDANLLGASDSDRPEDFANGYDFRDAFLAPFTRDAGKPIPAQPKIA